MMLALMSFCTQMFELTGEAERPAVQVPPFAGVPATVLLAPEAALLAAADDDEPQAAMDSAIVAASATAANFLKFIYFPSVFFVVTCKLVLY